MAIEGVLSYLEISYLLRVVGSSSKSGVLEISWEDRQARLLFDSGTLVCALSNRFHNAIGDLLMDAGVLTESQLDDALALQKAEQGQRRLGVILCDEFRVRSKDVEKVLEAQFARIAFDVFTWPGGRFTFHVTPPSAVAERFRLDPAEFILSVGIQAGILAEGGVEHEMARLERLRAELADEPR